MSFSIAKSTEEVIETPILDQKPKLTLEQQEVIEKMTKAMLDGKLDASDAMDFVENPTEFFEKEETPVPVITTITEKKKKIVTLVEPTI